MISTSRARKILGKKYSHLTDEQMEMLLTKTYLLADIVTNMIDSKVFQSPVGVIDSQGESQDD